jgi:hypothetical protein
MRDMEWSWESAMIDRQVPDDNALADYFEGQARKTRNTERKKHYLTVAAEYRAKAREAASGKGSAHAESDHTLRKAK